ncbi:MAG: PepSY-like domain-containing protein [Dysgonomonas sp.]
MFAEKDWNEYDVKLANGFEIEFFSDGTWKDIEANREAIPASILNTLPSKIATYINTNYKDWTLTDISKKKYGYEMELINPAMGSDVELKFNQAGELIKLDY